ncbi:glutathione S-transferase [Tricladium varicosporioides]|nr:glutathione S-transferase [Hymenoscyphus varicosporioides]
MTSTLTPAAMKPLVMYGSLLGPNPTKVGMVLRSLSLPFEINEVSIADVKKEPYISVNPNGRLPALYDPNTDITIWESGAIIEYVIETYDKDNKISFPHASKEDWECKQWLYLQASGQGPYYGQAWWFQFYHPTPNPSAIERYQNEVKRVSGVLDKHLAGKKFLVGDKLTYADISFIPWQKGAEKMVNKDGYDINKEFENVKEWMERLAATESIGSTLKEQSEGMAKIAEANAAAKKE